MKLLITGATGFVGQALCESLLSHASDFTTIFAVTRCSTNPFQSQSPSIRWVYFDSLDAIAADSNLLEQVDCIIHLAARVHQMKDQAADPLAAFRAVNVDATRRLAEAAAAAKVKRFIYLSSIKVYGEGDNQTIYSEISPTNPTDAYGESKLEAEQVLYDISQKSGLETVILRPPLVYGPGVKANFYNLMQAVRWRIPLPLGAIQNQRSFVYVYNLVDAITCCIEHPRAAGQTFLISDDQDVSTPELILALGRAFQRSALLVPIPLQFLEFLGRLTGKTAALQRLQNSFRISNRKLKTSLNWVPPHTFEQGVDVTVKQYLKDNG